MPYCLTERRMWSRSRRRIAIHRKNVIKGDHMKNGTNTPWHSSLTGQSCSWAHSCRRSFHRRAEHKTKNDCNMKLRVFLLCVLVIYLIVWIPSSTPNLKLQDKRFKNLQNLFQILLFLRVLLELLCAERTNVQARVLTCCASPKHRACTFCAAQRAAIVARYRERVLWYDGTK